MAASTAVGSGQVTTALVNPGGRLTVMSCGQSEITGGMMSVAPGDGGVGVEKIGKKNRHDNRGSGGRKTIVMQTNTKEYTPFLFFETVTKLHKVASC